MMPMVLAIAALAVAAGFGSRWRHRRWCAMTAVTLGHRSLGPDGIVVGGSGFVLERVGAPAVLLLHGAGDTPQTLRYLGEHLHACGFHIHAPLLPGHGRSLREFSSVTADQLTRAAEIAYRELRQEHGWVAVAGLSMGGALAVQLAATHASMPALVLLGPYLGMPRAVERAARLAWLWGPLVPAFAAGGSDSIHDPVERARGLAYGVLTPAALTALWLTMRRASDVLGEIEAPTLMIQSRQDNRISVAGATRAFARIGAPQKRLEWITGAGHVITVDFGRERVFAEVTSWLRARTPASIAPRD